MERIDPASAALGDAMVRNRQAPASTLPFTSFEAFDVDDQASRLKGWSQEYSQLSPGRFHGRLIDTWLDDVQVYRETTNRALFERGAVRAGSVSFVMQLATDGVTIINGHPFGPHDILVCQGGLEWCVRSGDAWDLVSVSVPETVLGDILGADPPLRTGIALHDLAANPRSASAVARLQRCAQFLFDIAANGLAAAGEGFLRDYVVENFAEVLHDATARAIARDRGALTRRVDVVLAACALVESDEAVADIASLCVSLGVPRRTLQLCFEDVTGFAPASFLRAIRLNRARRDIRSSGNPAGTVLDAAARQGFWHTSRFASQYRALFDELPSVTARRAAARR